MKQDQVILLVEDNDDDAELTEAAFRSARIANGFLRVRDGVEALDYIFARGQFAQRDINDLPAVVLLDWNLPRVSGLRVLEAIRASDHAAQLPVVVLTSSDLDEDRLAAYQHFANCYVRKPVDYEQFAAAVRDLGLFWLVHNQRPPRPGSSSSGP